MMTLVLRDAQINDDVAEVSDDWIRQPLRTLSEVVGSAWPRRGPQAPGHRDTNPA